jgi:2'-5' RNA ligase
VFARSANFAKQETDAPICFLAQIRPKDALKIWEWVNTLEWPEGTELEVPDEYHITILYAHEGWNDDSNHIWLKGRVASNFPVKATALSLFGPEDDTAVIEFDCPELTEYAIAIRKEALARGLKLSQYPFSAHLTVAKKVDELPVKESYPFSFRTDNTAIAVPLTHTRFSAFQEIKSPWHYDESGNLVQGTAGQSLMNHLRETYKLTPEEVWDSGFEDLGKD